MEAHRIYYNYGLGAYIRRVISAQKVYLMSKAIETGNGFKIGSSKAFDLLSVRFSGDLCCVSFGFPGEVTFKFNSMAIADKSVPKQKHSFISGHTKSLATSNSS